MKNSEIFDYFETTGTGIFLREMTVNRDSVCLHFADSDRDDWRTLVGCRHLEVYLPRDQIEEARDPHTYLVFERRRIIDRFNLVPR